MKRLLINDLIKWKAKRDRKPLILNGARQVGKTWLLQHFGVTEYQSVAYINCEKQDNLDQIFFNFEGLSLANVSPNYFLFLWVKKLHLSSWEPLP